MLGEMLGALHASWGGRLCRYDGSHLVEAASFEWGDGDRGRVTMDFAGVSWECAYTVRPVPERADALDVEATFRACAGSAEGISVAAALTFKGWSVDNYVVMPAALYNGNRFISCRLPYPPLVVDPALRGPDAPTHITDVPRLNAGAGRSRVQLITRDLTTPAVGIHDRRRGSGFWLLTDQATPLGDSGLEIEESDGRDRATLRVSAPGMRADTRYTICDMNVPCADRGAAFGPGAAVTLRLRLYRFDCPGIPALFGRFVAIRQDLSGPVALRHSLPLSAAWAIGEEKYNRDNWREPHGYYSVGVGESPYADWQVGWVGGGMVTEPLLFAGGPVSQARARRNLDFMFTEAQAPSGLFYGIGKAAADGMRWYGDGFGHPGTDNWHLIRKSADALYFVLKQFVLLGKQEPDRPLPETWTAGARRCAGAFVTLWDRYGQFGQFVDVETLEMAVGNSTSGSTAPGGLALAAQYFGEPDYLRVARAAAADYYERFVRRGYTTGGPGEICQCPDSESAFGLLESFVTLYEVTGEAQWLAYAQDMAHQAASWCMSYDFAFPPASLFGRMDMRAAGSVWANVQNKHSAPGIATLSGDSLLKLFRATGDTFYLELLRTTAHNITQYLSRADRPVGTMPPGWMTERVNTSDWLEGIGEIFDGSCWCEVSCSLTYVETPGLYIQPDTGFVCAIDHVDASVEEQRPGYLAVRVANPTAFAATVKLLVEKSTETGRPLGAAALWGCPEVKLAPGESRRLEWVG